MRAALLRAEPLPRKVPERVATRLAPFKAAIDGMLTEDLTAPKKRRHTARRILARLAEEHGALELSYSTVRDYVAHRRPVIDAEIGRTRLKLSLLSQFNGRYNGVADGGGFRDGLRRMRDFRADLKRRDSEEAERLASLERHGGQPGIDEDGLHIDRREFDVTKKRLDWIWTCQNGQYESQGDRDWDHLTDLIVDADRHGLPSDHGFVVETAERGQVWRAWRRTPGGAVLGTGGAEHRSQYYVQGDTPPDGWPGRSPEWVDAARAEWPPDWNKNDGTRL